MCTASDNTYLVYRQVHLLYFTMYDGHLTGVTIVTNNGSSLLSYGAAFNAINMSSTRL